MSSSTNFEALLSPQYLPGTLDSLTEANREIYHSYHQPAQENMATYDDPTSISDNYAYSKSPAPGTSDNYAYSQSPAPGTSDNYYDVYNQNSTPAGTSDNYVYNQNPIPGTSDNYDIYNKRYVSDPSLNNVSIASQQRTDPSTLIPFITSGLQQIAESFAQLTDQGSHECITKDKFQRLFPITAPLVEEMCLLGKAIAIYNTELGFLNDKSSNRVTSEVTTVAATAIQLISEAVAEEHPNRSSEDCKLQVSLSPDFCWRTLIVGPYLHCMKAWIVDSIIGQWDGTLVVGRKQMCAYGQSEQYSIAHNISKYNSNVANGSYLILPATSVSVGC